MKKTVLYARLLSTTMIAGILLSSCAGSSGETDDNTTEGITNDTNSDEVTYDWLAPYEDTVTVTLGRAGSDSDPKFPDGEALGNSAYTDWIKQQFNIEFEVAWLVSSGDISTKLSLDMVSGELPDIFLVNNRSQLRQLIDGGTVADLTEAVNNYSSGLLQDIYQSYGGTEIVFPENLRNAAGDINAFPSTPPGYEFQLTWIRQDWLDELNLDSPTTIDELVTVAEEFIDNKMGGDNTVGIELAGDLKDQYAFLGTPAPLYHNFGAYPGNWYIDESTGEYVYGSVQPEMKEALQYLADLYEDGILDKEFATKDWIASITGGQSGILFGSWWIGAWPLNNTKANDPEAEWVPLWIPSDNGEYNVYRPQIETGDGYWVVNNNFQNPEVLIKMVNIAAEQQNLTGIDEYDTHKKIIPQDIDTHYANVGYKFDYHAWPVNTKIRYYDQLLRLEPVWTGLVEQLQNGQEIPEFAMESFSGQRIVDYIDGTDTSPEAFHVYAKTLSLQLIAENKDTVVEKDIYIPPVTATMELAWSTLEDLENIAFVKIVMGEEPIESFDVFVKNWGEQGGTQITSEVNDAAGK